MLERSGLVLDSSLHASHANAGKDEVGVPDAGLRAHTGNELDGPGVVLRYMGHPSHPDRVGVIQSDGLEREIGKG
jgi:hypothetical protein